MPRKITNQRSGAPTKARYPYHYDVRHIGDRLCTLRTVDIGPRICNDAIESKRISKYIYITIVTMNLRDKMSLCLK